MRESDLTSGLPSPADLARVLRVGVRAPESLEVTRPIREAVKRTLEDISGGTAAVTSGEPPRTWGSDVQFLDHADVGAEGLHPVMRMNAGVLWWGVHFWGAQEDAEMVSSAFRQLGLATYEWMLEQGTGGAEMPSHVWGGGVFFRAFKRLGPEELEEMETLDGLIWAIARDHWWWYQRLDHVKTLATFLP